MDVIAYNSGGGDPVELGSIAEAVWTQGFRFSQERTIQVSKPIGAAVPSLFDRLTRTNSFSFAAGRSFKTAGEALIFFGTHPDQVPVLADLQFTSGGENVWLCRCGLQRVELVEKRGALVVFSYPVIGGTWGRTRA